MVLPVSLGEDTVVLPVLWWIGLITHLLHVIISLGCASADRFC